MQGINMMESPLAKCFLVFIWIQNNRFDGELLSQGNISNITEHSQGGVFALTKL